MRCRGRSLRGDTSDARIPLWAALAPSVSSFEIGHRVASITCSAPPPPYSLEPTASPTIAPVSTTRLGELHGLKVIFLDTPTCLARNKRQKSHLLALDRPHAHEVVQLPERHEPVFPAAGEISDSPTTKSKQTEHSLRISYLNARERTSTELFSAAPERGQRDACRSTLLYIEDATSAMHTIRVRFSAQPPRLFSPFNLERITQVCDASRNTLSAPRLTWQSSRQAASNTHTHTLISLGVKRNCV